MGLHKIRNPGQSPNGSGIQRPLRGAVSNGICLNVNVTPGQDNIVPPLHPVTGVVTASRSTVLAITLSPASGQLAGVLQLLPPSRGVGYPPAVMLISLAAAPDEGNARPVAATDKGTPHETVEAVNLGPACR